MRASLAAAAAAIILAGSGPAFAADAWTPDPGAVCRPDRSPDRLWDVDWQAGDAATPPDLVPADAVGQAGAAADVQAPPAGRTRTMAFEYSHAYQVRRKIHKYASFATIPLFIAQYAVGQQLYDGTASDSTRGLHGGLAAATGVLFGLNSVTGVWNLWEGRKDPNGRTRRMLHGILMLGADAGFVATGMLAPDHEGEHGGAPREGGASASTHRTVALTSMGVALASYLMMILWRD